MKHFFLILWLLVIQQNAFAVDCDKLKIVNSYKPTYARYFSIDYYEDFKILTMGIGNKLDKVVVTEKPLNCQTSLFVLNKKVEKFVATSTTHLAFLKALDAESKLIGFQGTQYIFNPKFNLKKIKNISYQLNSEELCALKPDLFMAYESNIPGVKTLKDLRKLNLPVVLNWDFAETHPLARAEWNILNASFFGKEKEALDNFKMIQTNYEQLRKEAIELKKIKVLIGEIQSGRFVTCGGKSDLALLIRDAGGELVLENSKSETQYFPLEKAMELAKVTKFWLPHNEWKDLAVLNKDSRYLTLRSVLVYNNNKLLNASGYNDYWENGLSRPDLMLKDLLTIIHPEKMPNGQTIWYKRLQ
jgi:iron complex transport system substrate-binding protein